jgi:hypothetical protein
MPSSPYVLAGHSFPFVNILKTIILQPGKEGPSVFPAKSPILSRHLRGLECLLFHKAFRSGAIHLSRQRLRRTV